MSSRLVLVAHGRTAAGDAVHFPDDEPLDGKGLAAVRRAALRLPRFGRAFGSPARAARETAEALGLDARIDSALRDQDWGRWRGRRLDEIAGGEPEAFRRWIEGADAAPPGGEPLSAVVARVGNWLDDRLRSGGRTLAITHATVLRAAALHLLGVPPGAARSIDVEPLTLLELASDGRRWALRRFGCRLDEF